MTSLSYNSHGQYFFDLPDSADSSKIPTGLFSKVSSIQFFRPV